MGWFDDVYGAVKDYGSYGAGLVPGFVEDYVSGDGGGYAKKFTRDFEQWAGEGGKPGLNQQNLPYFEEDRARLGGYLGQGNPFITGQMNSPYSGDWRSLITQLQGMASGKGPSLAEQQYRAASDRTMSGNLAMARSGVGVNPAMAARNATMANSKVQQGLASGVASARTQEQLGAIGALQGALGGAGQEGLGYAGLNQRNQALNQQAWLDILRQQLGLSQGQMQGQLGQPLGQPGPNNLDRLINVLGTLGPMAL